MSEHPADQDELREAGGGKPLLDALQGRTSARPPIWLMRQAGRYLPEYQALRKQAETFIDFCLTPDLAVEATLQPVRRYRLNAAILFSDILVVPHALGQWVGFEQGEGPKLEPVREAEAIDALELDGLTDRLAPVYEAAKRIGRTLDADVAFIGFAGAPWTVATYMIEGGSSRDFSMVKRMALGDPHSFGKLMDVLTEATIEHLLAQIEAGADVVQVFDSWAGVLSETDFERFAIEPMRRIVNRIKDSARPVPVIGFPRGAGASYAQYVAATGVDAVSLDTSVPLGWARDQLQPMATLQGNLDPEVLVTGGPLLERETRRIMGALGEGPFIFNLGHGVNKDTPAEHVAHLVDLVRGVP